MHAVLREGVLEETADMGDVTGHTVLALLIEFVWPCLLNRQAGTSYRPGNPGLQFQVSAERWGRGQVSFSVIPLCVLLYLLLEG